MKSFINCQKCEYKNVNEHFLPSAHGESPGPVFQNVCMCVCLSVCVSPIPRPLIDQKLKCYIVEEFIEGDELENVLP